MALTYVLGRVGQGKSYHIFEHIRHRLERDEGRALLLVPEQFTLQAERDLIKHLGRDGLLGVEVLSLSSLGERVLRETGGHRRPTLDEPGKRMVLRRVIAQVAGELRVYGPICRQSGFIGQLSDFISQMKQYQVDLAALGAVGAKLPADSLLGARLHDLLLLFHAFESQIAGRYLDLEDRRTLFWQQIPQSQQLKGALIFIDGYNTMSEQNRMILEQIISQAEATVISLCLPSPTARDRRVFSRVEQTYTNLHLWAQKNGIAEHVITCTRAAQAPPRSPEIEHLEHQLYAGGGTAYPLKPSAIRLLPAHNKLSELTAMAEEITRLLRDEGYRLRDIAVVMNDIGQYGPVVRRVMEEHGIPVFMDQKRDIMQTAPVRMLLSLLDLMIHDYPQPTVLAYLKSGLAGASPEEIAWLENYAMGCGIRGRMWTRAFTRGRAEDIAVAEPLRQRLLQPVFELHEDMKAAFTVRAYSQALFAFMERQETAARLSELTAAIQQRQYYDYAAGYRQLWQIILDCLDQMVELMGDMELDLQEYREVLEAGLASYELGVIPTMIDQVLIGSINRSMSHNVRAMFVLGLNDGVIPQAGAEGGLFSRADEEALRAHDISLGPDREGREAEERFLIVSALGKASERLYLSYALSDLDGSALRPSLLVDRIRQMFPALTPDEDPAADAAALNHLNGAAASYPGLIRNLRAAGAPLSPAWGELYRWY
ncbi:MAG: exodeoxyribonuclease V subunit gamma, partial [Syntrophomonadaceae bacterium]|nr:exodeoxyribonuclease V subunit gamma [Syntrophomonadaceae bacterium]